MALVLFEAGEVAGDFDVSVRISGGDARVLAVEVRHRADGRTVAHVVRGGSLASLRQGIAARDLEPASLRDAVMALVDRGMATLEPGSGH